MPFSLAEIRDFVKSRSSDISLFVIIALLIMLAFALGYITANYQAKEPIVIENPK